tara:strand:- start:3757 stop:5073 length:1317 start_codon:yes stop_codon:yes gene_type:complete
MNLNEFKKRRKQLMQMMGENSIAILPTANEQMRNRDVHFPFRPDSDFFYLSGFSEPNAVLVLIPNRPNGEFILFCNEKDPAKEQWDGNRYGLEGAISHFEADDAFPYSDLDDILPRLLEQRQKVFYAMGSNTEFDQKISSWLHQIRGKSRAGISTPIEFFALDHFLHDMRLYKSRAEVSQMRKAAKISAAAHIKIMQTCSPGMKESDLAAHFQFNCQLSGANQLAYPSIVGGGNNSCVLHYTENNAELEDGQLVLIDAGCELDCYASDITRTFPINGKFNKEQRLLYQVCLDAQIEAIDKVRKGNSWNDPHDAAVRTISKGLRKLGLLKGNLKDLIKNESYKQFFMHGTGHWIGMDVHDVGDYKIDGHWRELEPGMVLTIEPGIYIPIGMKGIHKKWQGIGIRIEDDVLVTKGEPDVLTRNAPKTIDSIENLMNRKNG